MRFAHSFEARAPIDAVWAALTDVERLAPCVPGAEITGVDEDGTYRGSFQVRLGPTTAAYRGSLKLEALDEEARVATMRAEGADKRGQGGGKATVVSTLAEAGDTTKVDVVTDLTITGRMARFGRPGMIQDVCDRLLRDFARCLQAQLDDEAAMADGPDAPAAQQRPRPLLALAPDPPPQGSPVPAGPPPPPARPARPQADARPAPSAQVQPINGFKLVSDVLLERLRRLVRALARRLRRRSEQR